MSTDILHLNNITNIQQYIHHPRLKKFVRYESNDLISSLWLDNIKMQLSIFHYLLHKNNLLLIKQTNEDTSANNNNNNNMAIDESLVESKANAVDNKKD